MSQWFYNLNNQQVGPIDQGQLQGLLSSGRIPWSTPVWCDGMPQWAVASAVPELAAAGAAVPAGAAVAMATMPTTLAYEAHTDVAHSQGVTDDPGPFVPCGKQMHLGKERWVGVTFVTPRAFYLVKKSRMASQTGYAVGGLVGALVASAVQSDEQTRTCEVGELPQSIQAQIDPKGKLAKKDIVVLPREAITMVKISRFTGLKVQVGADKFTMVPGMFAFGRVRGELEKMGWPLGVEMTPTINAPVSRGLRPGAKRKPMWLKVLYILIAIIIFIIVVVVRVATEH